MKKRTIWGAALCVLAMVLLSVIWPPTYQARAAYVTDDVTDYNYTGSDSLLAVAEGADATTWRTLFVRSSVREQAWPDSHLVTWYSKCVGDTTAYRLVILVSDTLGYWMRYDSTSVTKQKASSTWQFHAAWMRIPPFRYHKWQIVGTDAENDSTMIKQINRRGVIYR